jgi:hypothetical protein
MRYLFRLAAFHSAVLRGARRLVRSAIRLSWRQKILLFFGTLLLFAVTLTLRSSLPSAFRSLPVAILTSQLTVWCYEKGRISKTEP